MKITPTAALVDALTTGALDWVSADVRTLLAGSNFNLTVASVSLADSGAVLDESFGTGYSRVSVPARSINDVVASAVRQFRSANIVWPTMTPNAAIRYAVIYLNDPSGLESDHVPLLIVDFGSEISIIADDLSMNVPIEGMFSIGYKATAL